MPFDWANYLTLAIELRERDGEAELRTAISRAYYSAFHQARDYLEKELRFETSRYDSVHKRLWDQFKKHGRQFGGVGINGSRLNDARRIADYEDEIEDLKSLVERSFHWANNVIGYLDSLKKSDINR